VGLYPQSNQRYNSALREGGRTIIYAMCGMKGTNPTRPRRGYISGSKEPFPYTSLMTLNVKVLQTFVLIHVAGQEVATPQERSALHLIRPTWWDPSHLSFVCPRITAAPVSCSSGQCSPPAHASHRKGLYGNVMTCFEAEIYGFFRVYESKITSAQ
jgi:hypothetical protein